MFKHWVAGSLLMLCIFPVLAGQVCDKIMRFGVGTAWPPYVIKNANDRQNPDYGIDIDIVKLVFKAAHICLKIVALPSTARGLNELEKGNVDVLSAASFTAERAKIGVFSDSYRQEVMRIFSRSTHDASFYRQNLTQLLDQKMLGVVTDGAFYGEKFADLMQNSVYRERIASVASIEQRMQLLLRARVDFMIDDEVAVQFYLQQHQLNNVIAHTEAVHDNAVHLLLSRATIEPAALDKINAAIRMHRAEIEQIINDYTVLIP